MSRSFDIGRATITSAVCSMQRWLPQLHIQKLLDTVTKAVPGLLKVISHNRRVCGIPWLCAAGNTFALQAEAHYLHR